MTMRFFEIALIVLVLLIFTQVVQSQRNCGAVEYEKYLRDQYPQLESKTQFENWLSKKRDERSSRTNATSEEPLQIPVVVHVVHLASDNLIGVGSNIPVEQILSQIEVLNQDYSRQNPDVSNTPDIFEPVASSPNIEFVLARQDPFGLPTSGITRTVTNIPVFGQFNSGALKSLVFWPSEFYLNIWVAPLANGLLGFAAFPVSELPGLEDAEDDPFMDGVVIDFRAFGSNRNNSFPAISDPRFSFGRTATHEIGHFLGLRHVDGDGGCNVDDFCGDTPLSGSPSFSCPLGKSTCGSLDMIQNYLDLSDDDCMNLFTVCQVDRMHTVLENSPRRASLLTSPALLFPEDILNDLALVDVQSPRLFDCVGPIDPVIEIMNTGQDPITAATIRVLLDNEILLEEGFNLNLNTLESALLEFSLTNIIQEGIRNFTFEVLTVNNSVDQNPFNNNLERSAFLAPIEEESFFSIFEDPIDEDFRVENPDANITWELNQASGNGVFNQAYRIRLENYIGAEGAEDRLLSPVFDLTQMNSPQLAFRVAYGTAFSGASDALTVAVSTDCGETFDLINTLYQASGDQLVTTTNSSFPFIPFDKSQWRRVIIDLNEFANQTNVQFAFISLNDAGNSIYLDDIEVFDETAAGRGDIFIAPNPNFNGQFLATLNMETRPDLELILVSMDGKIVDRRFVQSTDNATVEYNLSEAAAGVYILNARNGDLSIFQRVVILN